MKRLIIVVLVLLLVLRSVGQDSLSVSDTFVKGFDGNELFLREIAPVTGPVLKMPILLLVHGGGGGGLASFDLPVPNGSFARSLVALGCKIYIMDIRGWENSTLPERKEADSGSIGSFKEAAMDIDAVINVIIRKEKTKKISLFGWASGGHWVSYYTTLHNDKVAHLITLNTLYGVKAPWSLADAFRDPLDSTRYNDTGLGRFRRSGPASLITAWENSIPVPSRDEWRDPVIAGAYQHISVSFTKDSTLKVPGEYRKEAFYMAMGHQYWNAIEIRVPTLVIRGALDFWSRPADLSAFCNDLKNAPLKKCVILPEGTHFVFLDRPAHGRSQLLQEIIGFLN